MINDYFDTTERRRHRRLRASAVRAAPDPVGLGDEAPARGSAILLVNAVGAAIMLYLAAVRGPLIIAFALAGLFVSVFYVAPPIRLKHHGLGEPGVFLVVGSADGRRARSSPRPARSRRWVLLVSVPYALLVTSVLFGKHIDKIEADGDARRADAAGDPRRGARASRGSVADDRVLPADDPFGGRRARRAVGAARGARRSRGCWPCSGRSAPRSRPRRRPATRPWPLWFVGCAFVHTRRAGGLLTLGLLLNALLPITLPWV